MMKQGHLSNAEQQELHRRSLNDVRNNIDRMLSSLAVAHNDGNASNSSSSSSCATPTSNQNKRNTNERTEMKAKNHPLFVPSTLSSFTIGSHSNASSGDAPASSMPFPELDLPGFGFDPIDDMNVNVNMNMNMGTTAAAAATATSNNHNNNEMIDGCLMEPIPINASRVTVVPKLPTKDALHIALQDETLMAFADMLKTRKAEVANTQRGLPFNMPGFAPKRRKLNDGGRSFYTPPSLQSQDSVVSNSNSNSNHNNNNNNNNNASGHLHDFHDNTSFLSMMTTSTAKSPAKIRCYQEQQWEQRYSELCEFQKEFNHCCVPYGYSKNRVLAQWVKRQRYQLRLRKDGKHSTMTVKRQHQLESIGFCWDSHKAQWEERYQSLLQFQAKNGHCFIPVRCEVNSTLAIWVKCQRRQYKLLQEGKASNMTQERIVRLNQLGFVWYARGSNQN